jgi:hypothetical protein
MCIILSVRDTTMRYILRTERTEFGKQVRSAYERGTKFAYTDMKVLALRMDGISNTITTILKDNLVCEIKLRRK